MEDDRFDQLADAELRSLEQELGGLDPDEVEVELASGVLTLTLADDSKVIVNSHRAARQIWMAAFRQAWHFSPVTVSGKTSWRTAKDELRSTLGRLLAEKLDHPVAL